MWKEFKEFATRGNVIDLAIGVIIGGAFQKIVNSLVNDVVMPAVSIFTGRIDFDNLVLSFGSVSIKYGSFITNIINFLIIAFSVFLMVRYLNKLNKTLEETAKGINQKLGKENKFFKKKKNKNKQVNNPSTTQVPTKKTCPYCLSEIPYLATRCSHCTSILEEVSTTKEIVGEQLEIEEK